jgi:hypothetical protein
MEAITLLPETNIIPPYDLKKIEGILPSILFSAVSFYA